MTATNLCASPIHVMTIILLRLLNLLTENVLEGDGVGSKLADALAELVHGHGLLVKVEAESRLIVKVRLLLNVERRSVLGIKLLRHLVGAVVQRLEKVWLQ